MASFMGVIYLLLASLLWAAGNIAISIICPLYVDATKVNFYVFFIWSLLSFPFFKPGKIKDQKKFLIQVALNVVYQCLATCVYAYANPNDCIAIISMSIFFTPFISYLLLNQRFNLFALGTILLYSFSGVLLLIQPPFLNPAHEITTRNMLGYGMAFIVVLARSTLIVLQRAHSEDSASLTFWTGVGVSSIFILPMIISDGFLLSSSYIAISLIVISVFYVGGMHLSFVGWKMVDPTVSAMLYQSQIVFTYVLSLMSGIEESIEIQKMVGIFIIVSGVIAYQYSQNNSGKKDLSDEEGLKIDAKEDTPLLTGQKASKVAKLQRA